MIVDQKNRDAIIYVATGDPNYARMCLQSISSLRDFGYEDEIFIITDQLRFSWPRLKTIIHPVTVVKKDYSSRYWKTQVGLISPYRKNIYLDCDILAVSDLKPIWNAVKDEGIGMALDFFRSMRDVADHNPQLDESSAYRTEFESMAEEIELGSPHYNSGVIFWKKSEATLEFFSHWHREWNRFSRRDQFALLRAIKSSKVSVYTLNEAYNFQSKFILTLAQAVGLDLHIVHFSCVKKGLSSFSRQIDAFKALSVHQQERFRAIVKASEIKNRDLFKLLPLMISFSISDIFWSFVLIFWSVFPLVKNRLRRK